MKKTLPQKTQEYLDSNPESLDALRTDVTEFLKQSFAPGAVRKTDLESTNPLEWTVTVQVISHIERVTKATLHPGPDTIQ